MKRYQKEEIEYHGLQLIRPALHIIPHPQDYSPAAQATAVGFSGNARGRFEDWLDGLSPFANPGIPVSLPSTVAESECSGESLMGVVKQSKVIKLDAGANIVEKCPECGQALSGNRVERALQTVSGKLIAL